MERLTNREGLTEAEFLKAYDANRYQKPSVTVDMAIFTVANENNASTRKIPDKQLQVLMIQRGDHPYLGKWALPGGFVNIDESLDAAAQRELKEETNLDNIYMEQLYTWGEVDRDPRTRVISTSYMALVDVSHCQVQAGDDASEAKWFTIKEKLFKEEKINTTTGYELNKWFALTLSSDKEILEAVVKVTKSLTGKVTKFTYQIEENTGFAFDHAKLIHYSLERMRNKVEYTDIAFNLMPELFTLTELQQVYEIILDRELLKANFRRKIAPMVLETNEIKKEVAYRPSKLYRFNPDWVETNF